MKHLVQIDSDSRMTWDFYACRSGDAGVEVDDETFRRWREVESAWRSMQSELRAMAESGAPELGDRLPVDEDEEDSGAERCGKSGTGWY